MCQVENAFVNKRRNDARERALELSFRYVICTDRKMESIDTLCGLMYLCIPRHTPKNRAYAVTFITAVSTEVSRPERKSRINTNPSREF